MKTTVIAAALAAGVAIGYSASMRAQAGPAVPGYDAAHDVAGAKELPDPKIDYKVVFDVARGAKDPAKDVNPTLPAVARYVNTLAKYGVPPEHRHIAVVFHQGGTSVVMNSETFKSRFNGQDNPNLAILHALKQAGVDFRVCGQALLANKIDPKQVNPDIEVDLWALTTMVNLEMRGYAHIGG
jgi:intracellular sulfur oxidation DsrE/DsrF family protein